MLSGPLSPAATYGSAYIELQCLYNQLLSFG
uniref:Uncharacterized protein n=1 Tax=Rhizophora mucronata TaxID=61149 RepID=A0A2P2LTC9_RHIMU